MFLGWDEVDFRINYDLCYVGMDFDVRYVLKLMFVNYWEYNFL